MEHEYEQTNIAHSTSDWRQNKERTHQKVHVKEIINRKDAKEEVGRD